MKRWLFALPLVLLAPLAVRAQVPAIGDLPVDIPQADQTYFENGVAVADGNVELQYGTTTIYADHIEYHKDIADVLAIGHVRIFREGEIFVGDRAVYNLQSRQLHAANFKGDFYPFRFSADSVSSIDPGHSTGPGKPTGAYLARDSTFTTSDSSIPDYQLRARSARIYPKDRIIMRDVTLYVGNVPVFWWPYLYQPLRRDMSYTIRPGFYSDWGFFTLSEWNFPITENWEGRLHVDYRAQRGLAGGLDSDYRFGPDNQSWGRFRTYFADDSAPPTVIVGSNKDHVSAERYRISVQNRVYLTDDLYASIDINKVSDVRMLRDFLPQEYRLDPQPDNVASLTQWDKDFTLSLTYRKQINDFNDVSERLPELALDVTRHAITPGSNFFYDGESSVARLRRAFATGATTQDYAFNRIDTYHEIIYPMEFWKFLSVVPRVGLRGDYYSQKGAFTQDVQDVTVENLLPNNTLQPTVVQTVTNKLYTHGAMFRGVIDAGLETSFKLSKEYPNVESRAWGLDDLRHVIQPYMDVSLAYSSVNPQKLLQVDRYQPSTQLPIFDFPQFNQIDTISTWAVWQVGVRNRLETKRDNATFNWLQMDTFVDINLKEPTFATGAFHQGIISNLYNNLTFSPLPWIGFSLDSQTPLNSHGFNDVNTSVNYMASRDLQLTLGHRYLDHDPFFASSSLLDLGGYYRINDNWSISAREEYEFANSTLENQTYEIHRDLSSWIASLGVEVEDNGPGSNPRTLYALLFTMTLKDMPAVSVPFTVDPSNIAGKNP
jgi:hypothetical protein